MGDYEKISFNGIPQFNGANYDDWLFHVKTHSNAIGLADVLTSIAPVEEEIGGICP